VQRRKFEEANSSVAITSNKTTELPVLPRWRGLTSVTEVSYIGDKVLPRWRGLTSVTRSYLGDRGVLHRWQGLTSVTRSYLGDRGLTSVTEVSYLGDKVLPRWYLGDRGVLPRWQAAAERPGQVDSTTHEHWRSRRRPDNTTTTMTSLHP